MKKNNLFVSIFSVLFACVMTAVAAGALFAGQRHPEEYSFTLHPLWMTLSCVIWLTLLLGTALLCRRMAGLLQRRAWVVAGGMLALFAVACAVGGWLLMVEARYDVAAVYHGAKTIAETGALGTHESYFYIRPNNLFATMLLSLLFRVLAWAGIANTMLICLVLNVLLLTGSCCLIFCVAKLLRGAAFGVFALFTAMCSLPMYAYAAVYYTDTIAMPFVIGGVLLYLQALRCKGRRRTALLWVCGAVLGFGTAIKTTVIIVPIAVWLHSMLQNVLQRGRRREWKRLLQTLACTVVSLLICLLLADWMTAPLLPDTQRRKNEALPITHWTMMGLAGDGRWNNADEVFSAGPKTQEARVKQGLAEIGRRVAEHGPSGMAELWARKSLYIFGDGTYNMASMLDDEPLHPGFLHGLVLYSSPHFMLFYTVCTGLHLVLLFCAAFAAMGAVLCKTAEPDGAFLLRLCWFGLWLFLMLWEANARYLVHFLPVLFVCAGTAFWPLLPQNVQKTDIKILAE